MHLSSVTASEAKRLALLLLIFVFLSGCYSFVTPLYEAPDEKAHLQFISWLAQGKPLPNIHTDLDKISHEIGQPPLYYGLLAPVAARLDLAEIDNIAPFNRYWRAGAGVNAHFHTEAENFPFRGTALTVHLIRLFSIVMGSITVAATYWLARIFSPRLAFTAAMLIALNPQFLFMSAVINNDNLVTALSTLTLLLLLKVMSNPGPPVWQYLLLGAVWGLAILSKLSGLGLAAAIGVGLAITAWRRREWQPVLVGGSAVGAGTLLVSGWWFWRNWVLYGDPLAWDAFLLANANLVRTVPLSWGEALQLTARLPQSFWGVFNYGVLAPDAFYWLTNGLMLVATSGIIYWLWAKKWRHLSQSYLLLPLLVWLSVVYVALVRWIHLVEGAEQGRLLYPAIVSLAVFWAVGLHALKRRWLPLVAITVLAMWAAALPVSSIQPAFATPPSLAEEFTVPAPQNVLFSDEIALLGYEVMPSVDAGDTFVVSLFWEGRQPMQESYVVAIRLLAPEGEVIAGIDSIPYGQRYPTPNWAVQRPFKDTYRLPIPETAVPGLAVLSVTLYPWRQTEKSLPVWVDGQPVGHSVYLTAVKIRSEAPVGQAPENNVEVRFGQQLQLFGYDAPSRVNGSQFAVSLYWQAIAPDKQDYTIFMHVVDEAGKLVAQADGPPQNGRYPTSVMEPGEQILDTHLLTVPEELPGGEYQILVGVYHSETGVRLPAINKDNERLPNDAVPLQKVFIIP